jgi:hypothetical protein
MKNSKIAGLVHLVRGQGVLLDEDLARMYGVAVKELNRKVQRNIGRFPPDFMFRLTAAEYDNLKPQMAASRAGWGGGQKRPRAFTEEGVAMLSSVLSSPCAIGVNVAIMRVH